MWQIAMCDPINRSGGNFNRKGNGFFQHGHGSHGQDARKSGIRKPKYCWKFNKNRQHDANCEFVHRCSFCDVGGHSRIDCSKRKPLVVAVMTRTTNCTELGIHGIQWHMLV